MAPLRFVFGGMIAISATALLLRGEYFPVFFWGFTAVILFPPVLKWIEKSEQQRLKDWQQFVLVVVSFMLGIYTLKPTLKSEKPQEQKWISPGVVRDTIFLHDTIKVNDPNPLPAAPSKKSRSKSNLPAPSNALAPVPQKYHTNPAPLAAPKRVETTPSTSGCTYNGNTLYIGPRGGCYYYTGSGKKRYVDRSYCSGCY